MKQPSDEALKNFIQFLLKTSVPRILAEKQKTDKTSKSA